MPYLLGLLVLVLAAPGFAESMPRLSGLAGHPRWQALLHVNQGGTLRDRSESYVDDGDFFLAENGKQDARAELRATRRALAPEGAPERCEFPARYRFLAEQLNWNEAQPLAHCEDFLDWREKMPAGQLVLVFPAAYLNSPSSMFGHTLLRLDPKPDPDSAWLSKAINFGARVDPDDNSVFYVWRGLAGGYPGRFSVVPYVRKIRQYAHLENRDMWEYALDLDSRALDWVVRHLWELRGINFDYFFLDENCSYRLLELIQVARPRARLLEELRLAELPVNTVRALQRNGLIAERRYRPSKAAELEHLTNRLTPGERRLAQRLRANPAFADSERFRSRPPERRHLIARTAYQALRFQMRQGPRDPRSAARSLALLRVMQRNPAPPEQPVPAPAPPEQGHRTQMLRVGGGLREGSAFGEFGWRLTYHDLVDPLTGFLPGAAIEGLDMRFRSTDSGPVKLEALDLIQIRSLSPRTPFVKPVSWYVHTGFERVRAGDRQRPVRFLEAGPGLAWRWNAIMPYGLLVARVENASSWTPLLETGGGAELGVVYQSPGLQADISVRGVYLENDFRRHRLRARVTLPLSQNNAVRGVCLRDGWRGDHVDECRLEFRHYFD